MGTLKTPATRNFPTTTIYYFLSCCYKDFWVESNAYPTQFLSWNSSIANSILFYLNIYVLIVQYRPKNILYPNDHFHTKAKQHYTISFFYIQLYIIIRHNTTPTWNNFWSGRFDPNIWIIILKRELYTNNIYYLNSERHLYPNTRRDENFWKWKTTKLWKTSKTLHWFYHRVVMMLHFVSKQQHICINK